MEYQEEQNLSGIGNQRVAESRAMMSVADTLQQWSNAATEVYQRQMVTNAQREASMVEPSAEAPKTKNIHTMVGRAYNEVVLEGHYAATRNDYRKAMDELAAASNGSTQVFSQGAKEYRAEMLNQVDPIIRAQTANDFDAYINPYLTKMSIQEQAANTAASVQEIAADADSFKKGAVIGFYENNEQEYAYNETRFLEIVDKVRAYDPAEADAMLKGYQKEKIKYALLGDYEAARAEGQGDAFLAELMIKPPEGIPLDEVADYVKFLDAVRVDKNNQETEADTNLVEANRTLIVDFEMNASSAAYTPQQFEEKMKMMSDNGIYSVDEEISIRKQYRTALEKKNKELMDANKDARLNSYNDGQMVKFLSNEIVVPRDQDGVMTNYTQKDYDSFYNRNADSLSFEEKTNLSLAMYDKGFIPKSYQLELNRLARSQNPEDVLSASAVLNQFNQNMSVTKPVLTENDEAYLEMVSRDIRYGIDINDAIEVAKAELDPDNAKAKSKRQYIKDNKWNEKYGGEVQKLFDTWGFDPDSSFVLPDMEAQYKELKETYYLKTGDEEIATRKAGETLRRTWGEFNGTVMRYPPNMIPQYGLSFDPEGEWMKGQLQEDMGGQYENYYLTYAEGSEEGNPYVAGAPGYTVTVFDEEQGFMQLSDIWYPGDPSALKEARMTEVYDEGQRIAGQSRATAESKQGAKTTPVESIVKPALNAAGEQGLRSFDAYADLYEKGNVPISDLIDAFSSFAKGNEPIERNR